MAILTIIEAIAGKLAADEVKAWLPSASQWFLRRAISHLPEDESERYAEEWEADLLNYPGEIARLFRTIGFCGAAWKIRSFCHRTESASITRVFRRNLLRICEWAIYRTTFDLLRRAHMSEGGVDLDSYVRDRWMSREFITPQERGELPKIIAFLLDVNLWTRNSYRELLLSSPTKRR